MKGWDLGLFHPTPPQEAESRNFQYDEVYFLSLEKHETLPIGKIAVLITGETGTHLQIWNQV